MKGERLDFAFDLLLLLEFEEEQRQHMTYGCLTERGDLQILICGSSRGAGGTGTDVEACSRRDMSHQLRVYTLDDGLKLISGCSYQLKSPLLASKLLFAAKYTTAADDCFFINTV